MLILVTRGECTHVIDFEAVRCRVGSLLLLKPSQAEMFDVVSDWDGWIMLFGPEFLFPAQSGLTSDVALLTKLEESTGYIQLTERESLYLQSAFEQMRSCCQVDASASDINTILRHYLSALLLRISLLDRGSSNVLPAQSDATHLQRFKEAVEINFRRWHRVSEYARALEVSEKTLSRATLGIIGVSAKRFIVDRISLEAKRLLAYTSLSASDVGSRLGFDEATNFAKFFRRETGLTPGAFRRQHRDAVI